MPVDKFLIAPMNSGLQTDLRPWQILDDSWAVLKNVYSFRGRIRKRFGSAYTGSGALNLKLSQLYSRLSIPLTGGLGVGTINAGAAAGNVPGVKFKVGQMFSIGTEIFTVYNPTAGNNPMYDVDLGTPPVAPATTKTFNLATGAYSFTGVNWPNGTQIYFYPAEPVMGLTIYENGPILQQPTYAFDTQFAYVYSGGFWSRSGAGSSLIFHGTDSDFFWVCNYLGATANITSMFVTNFFVNNPNGASAASDDPIWATQDGTTWSKYYPYFLPQGAAVGTKNFVQSARIIVQFKNRLLLLNTIENDNSGGGNTGNNKQYAQRCRFSAVTQPFATNAWYEPNQQDAAGAKGIGAGFIDAATEDQIVSAEFIKDRLIVYFENSTWEIVYTGNQIFPFIWQKINTELGSQSTFSSVPFDTSILTVGNVGIHSCTGANVQRIDEKIPNQIFQIKTANNGIKRVWGIRDYYTETVYWIYGANNTISTQYFPNQVLVYNYRNNSWAINDDTITALGYFEQQNANTWANTFQSWEQLNMTWASGTIQQNFRQVIAGNQQGYIFIISPDITRNASVLQISDMQQAGNIVTITITDHMLNRGDYITIENAQGVTVPDLIYSVNTVVDKNKITIFAPGFSGTYTGGGTSARVSQIEMNSKQWNPYLNQGQNFSISSIDFCVTRTSSGKITVDYSPSSSNVLMAQAGESNQTILGKATLSTAPYDIYPLEATQERLWHPVYLQVSGNFVQIKIYLSLSQITDPKIAFSDFQIEGIVLNLIRSGRLQ